MLRRYQKGFLEVMGISWLILKPVEVWRHDWALALVGTQSLSRATTWNAPESLSMRQVGEEDFFWEANGRAQFPKMAEDVDAQLQKYKAAVDELNRRTGAGVDADMGPNELMQVRRVPRPGSRAKEFGPVPRGSGFRVYYQGCERPETCLDGEVGHGNDVQCI